ncbi:MAG TPA: hypothetical protein VJU84_10565 [Pyrinomonadaceae bacterium]|nr:hypothetical protein [Pyrinomonadaceae bacterium]
MSLITMGWSDALTLSMLSASSFLKLLVNLKLLMDWGMQTIYD